MSALAAVQERAGISRSQSRDLPRQAVPFLQVGCPVSCGTVVGERGFSVASQLEQMGADGVDRYWPGILLATSSRSGGVSFL